MVGRKKEKAVWELMYNNDKEIQKKLLDELRPKGYFLIKIRELK